MKREPLTEVIPLRVSPSMKSALEQEAIKKTMPTSTYIRQIIDRRNGKH